MPSSVTRSTPIERFARSAPPRPARLALILGAFFLSLYVLTMSGHLDSPDEELMFEVTRSLAERGTLDIGSAAAPAQHLTLTGTDGQKYVPYGPVSSVMSVPFFYIGDGIARLLPERYSEVALRFGVGLRDPVVSAAVCVIFFLVALELGFGTAIGVLLTLAFGTATLVWPYAKYAWSEPVTCLWVLVSVLAVIRTVRTESVAWSAVSGITVGLAAGTKITTAVVIPILLLYVAGAGPGAPIVRFRRCLPFCLALLLPAAGLALFNVARFGDPLNSGYSIDSLINELNPIGIAGLLASPSKGLFLYTPLALLGLVGLGVLATRNAWAAGLFGALVVSHLALYGVLPIWAGDAAWGPRYLVPVLPYIVLAGGAVLAWTSGVGRLFAWSSFAGLAVLGVVVNLGGVLVDQRVSWSQLLALADGSLTRMDDQRWDPRLSPVPIHWIEFGSRVAKVADLWSQPVILVSGTYGREVADLANVEPQPSSNLLPSWTSGSAVFLLKNLRHPVQLALEYFDNRPDALGAAKVQIVIDGTPLPETAVRRGVSGEALSDGRRPLFLTAELASIADRDAVTLEINSRTWRPARDAPPTPDVRDLGIEIWNLHFTSDGADLPITGSVFSPMPLSDARPWSYELETWFYQPPHLADIWLWYLYLSDLPHWLLLLGLVPIVGLIMSSTRLLRQL